MASNKNYPAIKYTSRDFNSIKQDLIEYAKRYYPNTFQDFSDAGFGSLMLDTVAYTGDILSFYLDYGVNESFLDTAIEYNNILRLGKQLGFRFKGASTSFGEASFYIIAPAAQDARTPDYDYVPILKRESTFSSQDGVIFTLNEDINFADPENEWVAAVVDSDDGGISSFAIKATGRVISGELFQENIPAGEFQRFFRVRLAGGDISQIVSVIDSEGNPYYEVDFLSQDVIYKSIVNRDSNKSKTTSTLRPFAVPRRFTVERTQDNTYLQFGFGSERDVKSDPLIDPSKVVLDVHGKDYVTDVSFDPSNLLGTDKLGISPANTTLTISYRVNTTANVNISANSLINANNPLFDFPNVATLNTTKLTSVINSLEVNNEEPITGDVSLPSVVELKERIHNVFSSQNRAVTALDYKSLCYAMPSHFGSLKRVNVIKDRGSLERNLNIYVISENRNGKLIKANSTIKQNLRQWLNQGRMINDTIDILDTKIINIAIEFDAVSSLESNKFAVLNDAVLTLSSLLDRTFDIGEPFYIGDVYNELNKMNSIVDVTRVKIIQKTGSDYSSDVIFHIDSNMSDDDRYIIVPDNAILEVKFPESDIKGSIR